MNEYTQSILAGAGWFQGRRVDVSRWVDLLISEGVQVHQQAIDFLSEFGGLEVHDRDQAGVSTARVLFSVDPEFCVGEGDRFLEWSEGAGRNIVPVGELDGGRYFLGIDERSELYLVESWLATFGRMPAAIEQMVRGVVPADVDPPN